MSLQNLKIDELQLAAKYFGVDTEPGDNKKQLLERLEEDGVSWKMYREAFGTAESKSQPEVSADTPTVQEFSDGPVEKILLKMERENGLFEVRGVKFTRDNPYALVTEEDAEAIINRHEGFRRAHASEVKEYYG
jgi:hypothetical protein